MNLLAPLTGLLLAAAVIPPLILLYFLKLRRQPKPIATTLLWKRSVEDLRANAPFQRLRRSLLLLLQLLALLLLAFAVMQPQLDLGRQTGGRTIIFIDNSASMTARDSKRNESRLDEAKRRAREQIETMHSGGLLQSSPGETMIIAFSDRTEVYAPFSRSKRELLAAIDRITPTHGKTHIAEALTLARAYTTNVDPETARPVGEPAALDLYSDGRIQDLDEQVLKGESLTYHRVGELDCDNVTISAVSVERPYDRPSMVEVFVSLVNFTPEVVACDIQLSIDGTAIALQEISIPAAAPGGGGDQAGKPDASTPSSGGVPGRNNVVFTPFEQPRGAVMEIANLRDDDLDSDNVVQVVVPPPKRLRVGLVAPKSFLIRTVLEGLALEQLTTLTTDVYEARARANELDMFDVIVLDNYAPPEDAMPPGRYLALGATPPIEGLHAFGEHEAQIVLATREEHPALRFVNLENLYIASGQLLQPADDVQVLAEGSEGPVIVSISRGSMQIIHVTFDPLSSNWPFLRSFVTFIFNAIDFLGHAGEAVTTNDLEPGAALTTRLPAGAQDIRLTLPDGSEESISVSDPSTLSWGPIRLTGLYQLSWTVPGQQGKQQRSIAVNQLSAEEGRISAVEKLEIGQSTVAGRARDRSAYSSLWPWAIVLTLLILMLEWWVYHRRHYIG